MKASPVSPRDAGDRAVKNTPWLADSNASEKLGSGAGSAFDVAEQQSRLLFSG
jgi:hypothetical protein